MTLFGIQSDQFRYGETAVDLKTVKNCQMISKSTKKRSLKDRHKAGKIAVFLRKKKEFFVWVAQFWNREQLQHVPVESLYCDEESSCWLVDPALLDADITELKIHILNHELIPFREKMAAGNIELTSGLFEKIFELHVRETVHEIK